MLSIVVPPTIVFMHSPKITATRAVLLIFLIPAFLTLLRGITGGTRRLRFSDYTLVLTCVLMFLAFSVTEGIAVAAISANLIIMELLGGYLIARAFFASRASIQSLVSALKVAVLISIAVALFDHSTGQNWIHDTMARVFGTAPIETQYRNGFLRATAIAEHPILYGTYCVLSAGVLYFGRLSARSGLIWLLVCGFGAFLALSSAPLLSLGLMIGIIIYDKVLHSYPWRWKLLGSAILGAVVFLCIFSNSPIEALLRRLTLEPQTAFYRLLIWQFAGAEVLNSPWVGIGLRDWARMPGMTGSVDSLWLVQAMSFGIPHAVLFGITLIATTWKADAAPKSFPRDPYIEQLRTGLTVVLMLSIFIGFTVHLWGAMLTFLGMLMGLRTTIEEIRASSAVQAAPRTSKAPRRVHVPDVPQFAPRGAVGGRPSIPKPLRSLDETMASLRTPHSTPS